MPTTTAAPMLNLVRPNPILPTIFPNLVPLDSAFTKAFPNFVISPGFLFDSASGVVIDPRPTFVSPLPIIPLLDPPPSIGLSIIGSINPSC